MNLEKELERLRLENKSLSETVNYRDEELDEVKTQNNELREDINKVKGILVFTNDSFYYNHSPFLLIYIFLIILTKITYKITSNITIR